jgi:hypothetical protein
MAGTFNIKYKTRLKLQRAIQQQIRSKGLFQEGTMYDSVRVSSATGDLNTLYVTINSMYYYVFLDRGANLWNGGIIDAQFITYDALNSSLGKEFQAEAVDDYVKWMLENYPILDVAKISVDKVKVKYRYNVFGENDYGYSGFYPSGGWFEDF